MQGINQTLRRFSYVSLIATALVSGPVFAEVTARQASQNTPCQ
jgi:hypothetical protein